MPQRAPNATFWLKKKRFTRTCKEKKRKKKGVLLTPDAALSKQSLPWALKAPCCFSCISAALASLFGFLGQRDHKGDYFFFLFILLQRGKEGKSLCSRLAAAAGGGTLPAQGGQRRRDLLPGDVEGTEKSPHAGAQWPHCKCVPSHHVGRRDGWFWLEIKYISHAKRSASGQKTRAAAVMFLIIFPLCS